MDPKLSNLDPKLADAYNRVMNAPTAAVSPQNPPIASPYTPSTPPIQAPAPVQTPMQTFPAQPQTPNQDSLSSLPPLPTQQPVETFQAPVQAPPVPPTPPQEAVTAPPLVQTPSQNPAPVQTFSSNAMPGASSTIAFNANDSGKNQGTTVIKKRGSHIMPVVVGMGIIMLLTVYTFVWVMVFNVQIPFLPQF
jgi:hypothetical protein